MRGTGMTSGAALRPVNFESEAGGDDLGDEADEPESDCELDSGRSP
jgi:hypothetical protein